MRLAGMLVSAVLGIIVIAEGAYIARTRSQLADLSERIEQLGQERDERLLAAPALLPRGSDEPRGDGLGAAPAPARPRAPVPRFVPEPAAPAASGDPLPLPPAISSPEAREQLRQFVLAQLERERQETRVRQEQRFEERRREGRERATKELGLSPAETERFHAIQAQADAARLALRDEAQRGDGDRAGVRQKMQAIRAETDKQMRGLLGDTRMQKWEQLRRESGDAGPPLGRGGWGGGPRPGPPAQP